MKTRVPSVVAHSQHVRRRLCQQHHRRMVINPPPIEMSGIVALTVEPALRSPSFIEQKIRKIGSTTLIVATFAPHPSRPEQLSMPIYGLKAIPSPDGSVVYGGPYGVLFRRNGAMCPRRNPYGQAIDIDRHPALLDLALSMEACCRRRLAQRDFLPRIPKLPRILLGFAPTSPPPFEDTAALRRMVAAKVHLPMHKWGSRDPVRLERLLIDTWHEQLILHTAAENPTGLLLVDAELCTNARRSLVIFEDVRGLCGQRTRNPGQSLQLPTLDNPAPAILQQFGIDPDHGLNQLIPDDILSQLELQMRQALGGAFKKVDQSVIFDALTNPRLPVTDYAAALSLLRSNLPVWLQPGCTDLDLIRAVENDDESLLSSNSGKTQVIEGTTAVQQLGLSQGQLRRRIRLSFGHTSADEPHIGHAQTAPR